jgi:hypothetical protein
LALILYPATVLEHYRIELQMLLLFILKDWKEHVPDEQQVMSGAYYLEYSASLRFYRMISTGQKVIFKIRMFILSFT